MEHNTIFEVAEIELTYKSKVKPSLRPKVTSSKDAYEIFKRYWNESKIEFVEQFYVMLLNRNNKVLGLYHATTGTTCGTVVDPKSVFVAALKANACGVIVAHNHPSGSVSPSQPDIDLTKKLTSAGRILDVQLLDHVILTSEAYYSFADEGLL